MAGFERDVRRLLRENSCYFDRMANGDHELWFCPKTGLKVTVDSEIKSRHTANGIMKRAGIDHKF